MAYRLLTLLTIILIIRPTLLPARIQREQVTTTAGLQALLKEPADSLEIFLQAGDYHLSPTDIVDSTCGNCQDPGQRVPATAGLQISGDYVKISGPVDSQAVIHTNAGYGIFFNHCRKGIIEGLSVTDGIRDPDGNATDAAIVVKNSTVTIRHNRIYDNIGDSSIVASNIVGIMGICGRENSEIVIENNEIIRNSWDGIALYRDSRATIGGNLIDGIDKATAKIAGGGRGVGIGITWNAQATIEENLVRRYWKGIGIFVDARVTVANNIVEDILTWGIAYWDAGEGAPVGFIENNVVYSTGACGISIARTKPGPAPGHLIGNVIVKTAQNPKYDSPDYYCQQCALSISAKPDNFAVADNLFFDNREATEELPDHDVAETAFRASTERLRHDLSLKPLFKRSNFVRFLSEYR